MKQRFAAQPELMDTIDAAFERAGDPSAPDRVSPEDLYLLATGGLQRIPENRRRDLLEAIAADPALAQLVAQLHHDAGRGASDGGQAVAHGARRPPAWVRQLMHGMLAAAACLTIAMGAWRFADTPTHPAPGTENIETYQADPAHDYWRDAGAQARIEREVRDRMRDYALLLSAAATFVLAIPVAWWALRGGPRDHSNHR